MVECRADILLWISSRCTIFRCIVAVALNRTYSLWDVQLIRSMRQRVVIDTLNFIPTDWNATAIASYIAPTSDDCLRHDSIQIQVSARLARLNLQNSYI